MAVVLSSATLTIMAGSIIAPILNLMRENLGVAPSSVGLIITTHGLFMALFSPVMGSLIDRIGVKRPYVLALMTSAGGCTSFFYGKIRQRFSYHNSRLSFYRFT